MVPPLIVALLTWIVPVFAEMVPPALPTVVLVNIQVPARGFFNRAGVTAPPLGLIVRLERLVGVDRA